MISLIEMQLGWGVVIPITVFVLTMFYGQKLFFSEVYFLKNIFVNEEGVTFFVCEDIRRKKINIIDVSGYKVSDDVIAVFDIVIEGGKIFSKKKLSVDKYHQMSPDDINSDLAEALIHN